MKKLYTTMALLFILQINAQNVAESSGTILLTQSTSLNCDESTTAGRKTVASYSEWRNISCFNNLEYRIKAYYLGVDNDNPKFDHNVWGIQFRNLYNQEIIFDYSLYVGEELMFDNHYFAIDPVNGGVHSTKFWGIDCAGGSDASFSESKSLSYKLEIENLKFRKTQTNLNCDSSLSSKNYSATNKTNNSKESPDLINVISNGILEILKNKK
jgi:hypothetical protein